jgi:hypothetical protein
MQRLAIIELEDNAHLDGMLDRTMAIK